MSEFVSCPHCALEIENTPSIAGQVVDCAGCGQPFEMLAMETPVAGSVPTDQATLSLVTSSYQSSRKSKTPRRKNKIREIAVAGLLIILTVGGFLLWSFPPGTETPNPTASPVTAPGAYDIGFEFGLKGGEDDRRNDRSGLDGLKQVLNSVGERSEGREGNPFKRGTKEYGDFMDGLEEGYDKARYRRYRQ